MNKTIRQKKIEKAIMYLDKNLEKLYREYGEKIITISNLDKWYYALPQNYTNYQNGFLHEDCPTYRHKPILCIDGIVYYFRYSVRYYDLKADEEEKLLVFTRNGEKATVVFKKEIGEIKSYFDFLGKVKKYPYSKVAMYKKENINYERH